MALMTMIIYICLCVSPHFLEIVMSRPYLITFLHSDSFLLYNKQLANAWEEEDEVVLITCRLEKPDLDMVGGGVKEKLENFTNQL